VAASALLLFTAPLLALVAARIAMVDGGGVIFAHTRVGRHGRLFPCYKFRTMVANSAEVLAELLARDPVARAEWAKDRKLRHDPRITPIGRFLRKTSLDELPQLLNVLRGDMTLVGPRPCLSWEAEMFPEEFEPRFSVPPGLTGLWQVSGRSTLGTLDMLRLDVRYVESRSLRSDADILLRTVPALLRSNGAR
jgi:exopolysaccharide production protein ExoY